MPDRPEANDSTAADRRLVAAQIGREPRALREVAVRCAFGVPAVTRQEPHDDSGAPFPTAYYLTCPHLVRQIDRLEGSGGVRRYEQMLLDDRELREATARAHDEHASLDARGSNIAGAGKRERLKCLHAHAAFALAAGPGAHPLGDRVLREASPRWCDGAYCLGLPQAEEKR